ncbi:fatty acid desaturase [Oculatella sp. LEGE 06141]|uniref:fatty acid desaturase family protein n=1 Tax=Oculatella sp. LEGE 06141 TaxID=1828648 RepID=UPI0018807155|nr:fatty acid desaturase [Oculatella sp. LEGE 06141]MBE9182241.1 fatty acid desaturase [Oculatella sp. LEGE 06141]
MVSLSAPVNVSSYVHRQKPLWNAIALTYTGLGYGGGIALLLASNGWLNALGVALLTHSLVCAAYFAHEFMHGTVFTRRHGNEVGGTIMLWLTGSCYARFKDLAKLHIAHHVDRVDFSAFDLAELITNLPAPVRQSILVLEWLYFPAVSFMLQWRSLTAPFWNPDYRDQRRRVTLLLLTRISLFILLGLVSFKALLLYFVAYIGMITLLRWMDAFQHTYEVFPVGTALPERDRIHEQKNTFSTLLSRRYRWLNLLLLNFGYHNAHHDVMKCPWHSLHELDRDLFSGNELHYVPVTCLLANYHRFRVARIFSDQGRAVDEQGNFTPDTFYGAVGVSFLVLTC